MELEPFTDDPSIVISYQHQNPCLGRTTDTRSTPSDFLPEQPLKQTIPSDESTLAPWSGVEILSKLSVKLQRHNLWVPCAEFDGQSRRAQSPQTGTQGLQQASKFILAIDECLCCTRLFIQAFDLLRSTVSSYAISEFQQPTQPSPDTFTPPAAHFDALDDAIILLILSCHVRLINMYDRFFSYIMQHLSPPHTNNTLYGTITSLPLPGLSIGRFSLPAIPHLMRTQLILETVTDAYTQLQATMSRLRALICAKRSGNAENCGLSVMSDVVIELVLNHERGTAEKVSSLRKVWDDNKAVGVKDAGR